NGKRSDLVQPFVRRRGCRQRSADEEVLDLKEDVAETFPGIVHFRSEDDESRSGSTLAGAVAGDADRRVLDFLTGNHRVPEQVGSRRVGPLGIWWSVGW